MSPRLLLTTALFLVATAVLPPLCRAEPQETRETQPVPHETLTVRGRVVWLSEAITRLHGIQTVPESRDRTLALETDAGELYPIVEDIRGRAFRRDERLRKMNVELLARRYRGSPMLQIIRVYELTKDRKFEIDYWCEICAIVMFELKECDCCQGPIELRQQKAEK